MIVRIVLLKKRKKKIDKINQKLDLIKGVYKIDVYLKVLSGACIVTDNPFLGLIDLIHSLEHILQKKIKVMC